MSALRTLSRSSSDTALQWCIEDLPAERLAIGSGSAIVISGWCFHRKAAITRLRLQSARGSAQAAANSLPRPDVFEAMLREGEPSEHSYASGFYAVLPLSADAADDEEGDVELFLEVELAGGDHAASSVGRIPLTRSLPGVPHPALAGTPVVICMATYDPDYELFARQIESIVGQSETGWRCLINDDRSAPDRFDRIRRSLAGDDRFVIERNADRKGTYRNFEHALAQVHPDATYVALADQDDCWYPDKLAALIAAVKPGTLLAYSDSRICGPDGRVLGGTFFPRRKNNWRDLRQLTFANTVTGAASLFRRELIDDALPFPPELRLSYHDHWLALVALSLGELAYVDRALYDYVQHGTNLLGHADGQNLAVPTPRAPWLVRHRLSYQQDLLRVAMLAAALESRLGARLAAVKRRELQRLRSLADSRKQLPRLAFQAATVRRGTSTTMGVERDLLAGLVWQRLMARAGRTQRHRRDNRYSGELQRSPDRQVAAERFGHVAQLSAASTPLALSIDARAPERINLLLAQRRSEPLTSAHLVEVQLAVRLSATAPVRIVLCGGAASTRAWRAWLPAVEGMGDAGVECVDATDRAQALPVSPGDSFLATDWSTALIAHAAVRELGSERFVYMIQEYEPASGVPGSLARAAEDSLRLPHYALFSSEFLLEQFRAHRLGVFAENPPQEAPAISFCIPVTSGPPPTAAELTERDPRRLLLHARPDDPASLFETALVALGRAAASGTFEGWELNGFGNAADGPGVELAPGTVLVMLGQPSARRYGELIRSHDVGLSVLPASRPSSVALDMARAGVVTVTNTYGPARHHRLAQCSSNLISVEATVAAIEAGLGEAVARAKDVTTRVDAATLSWPSSWDEAFEDDAARRLTEWLAPRPHSATGSRSGAVGRRRPG